MPPDPSTDPRVRAAVAALIKGAIADSYDGIRREAAETMMDGDTIGVALPGPDGEPVRVGTVNRPKPAATATVTDEAAAIAWVREHMPTELTETIRPQALRRMLSEVAEYGGVLVRGEVVPVDWAEPSQRPAAARVNRPRDAEARAAAWAAVGEAWRSGRLSFESVLRPEIDPEPGL